MSRSVNQRRLKIVFIYAVVIFVLTAVTVGIIFHNSLTWRMQLYTRKALGGVPDLSWPDLVQMTTPSSGFVLLPKTVKEGLSLDAAVINPYVDAGDRASGADIFRKRCVACHDGSGARAPLLDQSL